MERGSVYWVRLPARSPQGSEIAKSRPCVVMSATALNKARITVLAIPLSTQTREYPPISVRLASTGENSVAICDQLAAIDKRRFGDLVCKLTDEEMDKLVRSLRQIMELETA